MGSYLGQNFLIDSSIRHYIADKISSLYKELGCEALIEIGPGKGSITTLISHISESFFVIEKDSTFIENLKFKIQNLKLIQGDVLEVDVEKILESGNMQHATGNRKLDTKKTLVVGNLPYYITSPILRKFFTPDGRGFDPEDSGGSEGRFAGGIFMLQDEVGQKLRSDAKKKSYLRWLINFAYNVKYLKGVPAKCFKPAPKVKSCLVELKPSAVESGGLRVERDKLILFLELFAPFSRKTLGAIEKIVDKQNIDKRFTRKAPSGREESSPSVRDQQSHSKFIIPEGLKKKRLEEIDFEDLAQIMFNV